MRNFGESPKGEVRILGILRSSPKRSSKKFSLGMQNALA